MFIFFMFIIWVLKFYYWFGEGCDLSSSWNRDLVLIIVNVVDVWSLNSGDIIDGCLFCKKGGWFVDGVLVCVGCVDFFGFVDYYVWV